MLGPIANLSFSAIAVTDITPSSASITWTTDEPAYSQVEFSAPCPSSGCLTPYVATMLTSHRLDVSNLTDSTTYTFRVRAKDASNNVSTSMPQSFKTGAKPLVTPTTVPATPTNLEALCNGGRRYLSDGRHITAGRQYAWWVHAANSIGLSGATVRTFTCPAP